MAYYDEIYLEKTILNKKFKKFSNRKKYGVNMFTVIDKGGGKGISIQVSEYKKAKFMRISDVWRTSDDEEWKHSKNGVTINKKICKEFLDYIIKNKEEIINELE